MKCELCEREVEDLTIHHLIPKQKAKQKKAEAIPTANICSSCHRQIHSFFDNTRLAQELHSLEALRNEPKMAKFLAWLKKQKSDKRVQVHRTKTAQR